MDNYSHQSLKHVVKYPDNLLLLTNFREQDPTHRKMEVYLRLQVLVPNSLEVCSSIQCQNSQYLLVAKTVLCFRSPYTHENL